MVTAFLIGYYGFDNFGDDILEDIVSDCILKFDHLDKLYILSTKTYKEDNIQYINRNSFFEIVKAFYFSKYTVFGGGGIFQDVTSFFSLLYYCTFVFLSGVLKKKVLLLYQGIGPLKRRASRILIYYLFNNFVNYISVRDRYSFLILKALKIKKNINLSFDPSYRFFDDKLKDVCSVKNNILGINVRYTAKLTKDAQFNSFFKSINSFCHAYKLNLVFYIAQVQNEKPLYEYSKSIITCPYEYRIIDKNNYGTDFDCNYFVGMRYHLLVLALVKNIPLCSIIYDKKVQALAKYHSLLHVNDDFCCLSELLNELVSLNIDYKYDEILEQDSENLKVLQEIIK